MAVSSVSSGNGSTTISNALQQTTGDQALDQNAFLKLLVTQLTNQDPLNPQDQSQFLAQLAQFSTVEGVNNMATSESHLQASTMLGRTVDATIVNNNVPQSVTGKVISVRWDNQGVHLGLDSTNADITMDQITDVKF